MKYVLLLAFLLVGCSDPGRENWPNQMGNLIKECKGTVSTTLAMDSWGQSMSITCHETKKERG